MHPGEVAVVAALVVLVLPGWLAARQVMATPRGAWRSVVAPRWVAAVLVLGLPVLGPVLWWRWLRPRVRTT